MSRFFEEMGMDRARECTEDLDRFLEEHAPESGEGIFLVDHISYYPHPQAPLFDNKQFRAWQRKFVLPDICPLRCAAVGVLTIAKRTGPFYEAKLDLASLTAYFAGRAGFLVEEFSLKQLQGVVVPTEALAPYTHTVMSNNKGGSKGVEGFSVLHTRDYQQSGWSLTVGYPFQDRFFSKILPAKSAAS